MLFPGFKIIPYPDLVFLYRSCFVFWSTSNRHRIFCLLSLVKNTFDPRPAAAKNLPLLIPRIVTITAPFSNPTDWISSIAKLNVKMCYNNAQWVFGDWYGLYSFFSFCWIDGFVPVPMTSVALYASLYSFLPTLESPTEFDRAWPKPRSIKLSRFRTW